MKKIKRSTGVALAFLIYVSVTAAYLLPRNTEVSQTEKYLTVAGSYVIVLLLWLVLRKKELPLQGWTFLTVKMMMLNLGSARKPVHFWQTVLH